MVRGGHERDGRQEADPPPVADHGLHAPDQGPTGGPQEARSERGRTGGSPPPRRLHLLPAGGVRAGERVGARQAEDVPKWQKSIGGFWDPRVILLTPRTMT